MVIGQLPSVDKGLIEFFFANTTGLEEKRKHGTLGKKISSKPTFLVPLLHNSSEDAVLLFLLHPSMVLSSLCLFPAKSDIGVFGKDNTRKSRGDDSGSISADVDKRTRADNLGTGINADAGADNPSTATDDLGIAVDNPSTATDDLGTAVNNLGIATNDLCIRTNTDVVTDNSEIPTDDSGTGTDANARADALGIAASNKAHAASLFALHCALFSLASFSELVTASLPSSLPSSSSTTLGMNPIVSCSVALVKQEAPFSRYFVDKM